MKDETYSAFLSVFYTSNRITAGPVNGIIPHLSGNVNTIMHYFFARWATFVLFTISLDFY